MSVAVRRSRAITLRFEERMALDVAAMLRGSIAVAPQERLVATSMLTGASHAPSDDEWRLLSAVSSTHWTRLADVAQALRLPPHVAEPLLACGVLLSDAADGDGAALRTREERYISIDWDEPAAQYHVMSRMKDEDVGRGVAHAVTPPANAPADSTERVQEYVELATVLSQQLVHGYERYGPPPSHFHHVPAALAVQDLPPVRTDGRLIELLTERKTIRLYDHAHPMTAGELSTLLYYTYGAQGWAELVPGLIGLRKTSPSGGSLHPVEAYPLIVNVTGVDTGLYHYDVERHALSLLRRMSRAEAEELAETITLGQSFYRSAHALFILTARWYRNFWKYRKAQKSYKVIHLDAGHLSQTLYLLCGDMGLGAFFTGAVNDVNIEELLGIDPLQEGVIGISGCGRPLNGGAPLTLQTAPYAPRR